MYSNFLLFAATFFNLQPLYFICSNFLICSMSLVGYGEAKDNSMFKVADLQLEKNLLFAKICIRDIYVVLLSPQ